MTGAETATGADAVLDWNAVMQATVTQVPDPFLQVRSATITQLAVFDAVNVIVGDYQPYLGSVTAPPGASPEAAAIAAAHRALASLHPNQAASLDAHRVASLAAVADGSAKDAGLAVGEAAALAMLAERTDDGSDDDTPYTPGTAPGRYRPTPPDFTPAFRPGLGQVDTFAIKSGAQFRVDPPPALRSARYTRDYDEVKKVGELHSSNRPPDRAAVARFYAVNDAVQIYFPAAREVSQAQGRTLAENARVFALLGMAIFDAVVACFDSKYVYDHWRPVTAIHLADHDGNRKTEADANWATFVPTPPFPSYPSGNAAFGAAARRVLERTLGRDGHAITLASPLVPDVVLRYTSWKQITHDGDDARIYGGVHYRFDQEEAARQSRRVGTYVLRHWLPPLHRHADAAGRSIERRSAVAVSGARRGESPTGPSWRRGRPGWRSSGSHTERSSTPTTVRACRSAIPTTSPWSCSRRPGSSLADGVRHAAGSRCGRDHGAVDVAADRLVVARKAAGRDRCGELAGQARPAGPGRRGRTVPPPLTVDS